MQSNTINKPNRNGDIIKKPGRKKKKETSLTLKQAKFIEVFNITGNASIAKKQAGYSPNTDLVKIRNSGVVCGAMRDIRQELADNASKYLDVIESIMLDDSVSAKVRADCAMNLLDRAGYKAVEKKEVTGSITGSVSSTLTLDLIQRTRKLMSTKQETIEAESVAID